MCKVREITICSVTDEYELGTPGHGTVSELNWFLKSLCAVEGAKFLDLRPALRRCRFNGINRTGYLYTAEGARSVSKSIADHVPAFFE